MFAYVLHTHSRLRCAHYTLRITFMRMKARLSMTMCYM